MVRPHGTTFGIESAATDRACASNRTLPPDEDDIEFTNDARSELFASISAGDRRGLRATAFGGE
jgi:hypothetical protein